MPAWYRAMWFEWMWLHCHCVIMQCLRRRQWWLLASNVSFCCLMIGISIAAAWNDKAWLAAAQGWGAGWFGCSAFWQVGIIRRGYE